MSGSRLRGAEINAVIGGSGPPVLMFHGAPDSAITWRLIADELAKDYTLVMCDLPGYGDSSRPEDKPDHSSQSKRSMALDGVEVMQHLGYNQFRLVGHDRGGRVGRRAAIDHPDKVLKLVTLDIVPAHYLYSHVNIDFVRAAMCEDYRASAMAQLRAIWFCCNPSANRRRKTSFTFRMGTASWDTKFSSTASGIDLAPLMSSAAHFN